MRIEDENERAYYQKEAEQNSWSVRTLERQINSAVYHRLMISKNPNNQDRSVETNVTNPLETLKTHIF
jgi:predicted nuclease of restriction endonuclease-like (RecB) superfamily